MIPGGSLQNFDGLPFPYACYERPPITLPIAQMNLSRSFVCTLPNNTPFGLHGAFNNVYSANRNDFNVFCQRFPQHGTASDGHMRSSGSTIMSVQGLLNPSPQDSTDSPITKDAKNRVKKTSSSSTLKRAPAQKTKRPLESLKEDGPNKRRWKVVLTPDLAVKVYRQRPPENAKKSSSILLSQRSAQCLVPS